MYIVVDSNNINSYLKQKNKGNWLVWYYADWCGHCHRMMNEWEDLVQKIKSKKNINLAKVQDVMLDKIKLKNQIRGFPTVRFVNNGRDISEFMDERNSDNLIKFTNDNIKKMKKRVKSKKKLSRRKKRKSIRKKK